MHFASPMVSSAVWVPSGHVQGFLVRLGVAVRAVLGTPVMPCSSAVLYADAAPCHAGKYAAEANDAQIVDPREYYQGSLKRTLKKYPHIGKTIPAMGYSAKQVPQSGKESPRKGARILARPSQPCLPSRLSDASQ